MILVTGGAGFIGGNYIWNLKNSNFPCDKVLCLDKLTYASNLGYIQPLIDSNFVDFFVCDISNKDSLTEIFNRYNNSIEYIINFAAETHVDNSIHNYQPFIQTNILGTINLLENALNLNNLKKFIHISTDEVFGSLELAEDRSFHEYSYYNPNSPYSASKASSDHFVNAFHKTYGLPTIITNCSNNYGPAQHKEKFIPTIIIKALQNKKIPVYGDGKNIRDWLYVSDHCDAINLVLEKGIVGNRYNIGGGIELHNIDLVKLLLNKLNKNYDLIEYVKDRPGHDLKYSIDCSKIKNELGYYPKIDIEKGLSQTVNYFIEIMNI